MMLNSAKHSSFFAVSLSRRFFAFRQSQSSTPQWSRSRNSTIFTPRELFHFSPSSQRQRTFKQSVIDGSLPFSRWNNSQERFFFTSTTNSHLITSLIIFIFPLYEALLLIIAFDSSRLFIHAKKKPSSSLHRKSALLNGALEKRHTKKSTELNKQNQPKKSKK